MNHNIIVVMAHVTDFFLLRDSCKCLELSICLSPTVNYSTLATFRRSTEFVHFKSFLKCDTD